MFRKRLVASVAAMPLLLCAGQAWAETTISDTRNAPVVTSVINDDVKVATGGKIKPTATPAGGSLVVDSSHDVINEGEISTRDVDNTAGILVNGGVTANITNRGLIQVDDTYNPKDTDGDGDLDGEFAEGTGRYGIRVTGAGTFTGDILNDYAGSIVVDGNDSFGISVESTMVGDFINRGSVSIIGDDTYGIRITAPITGDVEVRGSVSAIGENAIGVALDGDIDGDVLIQGTLTARGFRYSQRPTFAAGREGLEDDDKLPGGPALQIAGNVTGGVLLGIAPTADNDLDNDGWVDSADTDDDNDGILDANDTDDDGDGITDDDYDDDGTSNANDNDDDNDGVLDADDDDDDGDGLIDGDSDGDGIVDTQETASTIASFGAAPAMLVGSTSRDITLGAVGTGDDAYGLIVEGSIAGAGLLDDVSATGLRIGASGAFDTVLAGGLRVDGAITAQTFNGGAQAIHIAAGADVPAIVINGAVAAGTTTTSTPLASEDTVNVFGIRIDAGSTVNSVLVTGAVTATISGERGNAVAIWDNAGGVTSVVNQGTIAALINANDDAFDTDDDDIDPSNETILGQSIALDLRNATAGVTIVQFAPTGDTDGDGVPDATDADIDGDGVVNADDDDSDNDGIKDSEDDENGLDLDNDGLVDSQEPSIIGSIILGSGADLLDIQNGVVFGDVSFGAGADVMNVGTTAWAAAFAGEIADSDGQLTINLNNGFLQIDNTGVVDATALNVADDGTLVVTADPDSDSATQIQVATANIETGAQLGLQLTSLVDGPVRYTIIKTDTPAGLTAGTIDASLLGDAPYLVVAEASSSAAAGEVYLDLRRRTSAEIGLTGNNELAFDAFYAALSGDEQVLDAFLAVTDREDFMDLYEQMLPDQGEGAFSAVDSITRTISRLTATRPDLRQRYGPDSFWMQEVNVQVMRESGVNVGSETQAFGFVGGYESMGADGGALGATLAFISAEEKDDVAQIGEETTISMLEAGVYWRRTIGGWTFNARGAGGYAWFDGDRVFISPDDSLIRQADSGWNGLTGVASASVAYEATLGRFFILPMISADYLYMKEDGRQESGGGDAFNLTISERTSTRLSGTAQIGFGATFGRELWWRPELRLGFRQHLAGDMGDTVFAFKNGQLVTLPASTPGDGSVIVGLSLKAGTPMSYVAIEGEYEATDGEDQYNLQMAGRVMF
ncbi:MAG: autotransporter domain-containing protein [Pseudomonadota bacterium]